MARKIVIVRDAPDNTAGLIESVLIESKISTKEDLTVFSQKPEIASLVQLLIKHKIDLVLIQPIDDLNSCMFFVDNLTIEAFDHNNFSEESLKIIMFNPGYPSEQIRNSLHNISGARYATTESELYREVA